MQGTPSATTNPIQLHQACQITRRDTMTNNSDRMRRSIKVQSTELETHQNVSENLIGVLVHDQMPYGENSRRIGWPWKDPSKMDWDTNLDFVTPCMLNILGPHSDPTVQSNWA
jgi:hypothetical protein